MHGATGNTPANDRIRRAIANDLERALPDLGITLLPTTDRVTIADIRSRVSSGPACVCDCYIEGIDQGASYPFGFEREEILNIDHHAPVASMMKPISSGNLAVRYLQESGPCHPSIPVLINHTDCDSVISSLLVRGLLPPEEFLERAVLAADHFGYEDPVADLLQALDVEKDLSFSVRNLVALLRGDSIEHRARELLDLRMDERARAAQVITDKLYEERGGLVVVTTDRRISGEFLPPLFPDAHLILAISHHASSTAHDPIWEMKLRRGNAAPDQFNLFSLEPRAIDPGFGGRWNAGSNGRAGGSRIHPTEYIDRVSDALSRVR